MTTTYQNAICLPCTGCENKALFPNAWGGVFDSSGEPIQDAFLRREYRVGRKIIDGKWDRTTGQEIHLHPLILPGEVEGNGNHLAGTYIFAGYLFPHFGHFLLESLANLWFIKQHSDVPLIWLGVHNQSDLNQMNRNLLGLLGVRNPVHILTEETEIQNLIVPEPGYRIHTRYSPAQVKALEVLEAPEPTPGKKVWLSRSGLKNSGFVNETRLETFLERAGWIIFRPEQFPLRKQLETLADAEIIAGVEGSAFHLLMMISGYQGQIKMVARGREIEFDFIVIAEELGLNQEILSPASFTWSHGLDHWEWSKFWPQLDPILKALKVQRSNKLPIAPAGSLSNIVSSVTKHFKSEVAMELWARADTISPALKQNRAVLISPCLDFDTQKLPDSHTHSDITPDQFFTTNPANVRPDFFCFRHHDNEQDLVRAFNSSVQVAPQSAIWVIEYYADERTVENKNFVPETDRVSSCNAALVKYVASCFPLLSVARIRGAGAAIVWSQPRLMYTPAPGSFRELADYDRFERAPVMSLQEAATLISEARKSTK